MRRIRVNALSEHDGQQENDVDEYQVRNLTQGKGLDPFPPGIPDGEELPYFVEYSDGDWSQGDEVEVRAVDTDGNVGDPISFASADIPVISWIDVAEFVSSGNDFTVDAGLSVTGGSVSGTATYQGEERDLPATFTASGNEEQSVLVTATEDSPQRLQETAEASFVVGRQATYVWDFEEDGPPYKSSGTDDLDLLLRSGTAQKTTFSDGSSAVTGCELEVPEGTGFEGRSSDYYAILVHLKVTGGSGQRKLMERDFGAPPELNYAAGTLALKLEDPNRGTHEIVVPDEDIDVGDEIIAYYVYQRESAPGAGDGIWQVKVGTEIRPNGTPGGNVRVVADKSDEATFEINLDGQELALTPKDVAEYAHVAITV